MAYIINQIACHLGLVFKTRQKELGKIYEILHNLTNIPLVILEKNNKYFDLAFLPFLAIKVLGTFLLMILEKNNTYFELAFLPLSFSHQSFGD